MASKKVTPSLLTPAERAKLDQRHGFVPNLVAVFMSFAQGRPRRVYQVIKEECAKLGLEAMRVDENAGSPKVLENIETLISESEFIICDMTLGRPNVYYELGYAHGLGHEPENILLIATVGARVHFDVSGFHVRRYGSMNDLRSVLRLGLQGLIDERE